eukprot:TRINITY_DN258_c0_g1_i1.p1 TRINITY_DN258_c0_g1~~TRINITY_DN258_c0_g1_i1.p1  ORF type:complete len:434 (+),score=119.81 TRINITY_DN258_c0_g1_i1:74-1375(+)
MSDNVDDQLDQVEVNTSSRRSLARNSSLGTRIEIKVDEPEKHGEDNPMTAYASYRVSTSSDWSVFSSNEVAVRRRYRDFVWLRTQLVKAFPTMLVPPLPEKQRMDYLDRLTPEFLEKRRRFLEKFLQRVSEHPKLRENEDFHSFLEAKSWALETVKIGKEEDYMGNISSLVKTLTAKPKVVDEKFENLRHYVNDLEERLTSIDKALQKIQKLKTELSGAFAEMGASLLLLSDSEIALCDSLASAGRIFEQTSKFLSTEAFHDDIFFNDPIKEYVLYTDSIKAVQKRRDVAQAQVEAIEGELMEKREERADLENPSRPKSETPNRSSISSFFSAVQLKMTELQLNDPEAARQDRIQKVDEKIRALEASLDQARAEADSISNDIVSEMRRFNFDKIRDFKHVLTEYGTSQVAHHRKTLEAWEQLLPVLNQIDISS